MFCLYFVLIIFIKDVAACISLAYLGLQENRKKAMQPGLLNKGIPQLTWLVVSRKYQLQGSGDCSSFSFPFLASAFLCHPQALSKAAAVQALIFIHPQQHLRNGTSRRSQKKEDEHSSNPPQTSPWILLSWIESHAGPQCFNNCGPLVYILHFQSLIFVHLIFHSNSIYNSCDFKNIFRIFK